MIDDETMTINVPAGQEIILDAGPPGSDMTAFPHGRDVRRYPGPCIIVLHARAMLKRPQQAEGEQS